RFGLMAISSWRCQLDFPGSRLSSVGQRPRDFRHGLRAMHHVKWDCFVWLTDLDCGKASSLLRSLLDLGRIPAAPEDSNTRVRRADERGVRYKTYVTTTPRPCSSLDLSELKLARLRTPCNFVSTHKFVT